ncbi:MAG TPA: iron ABC transporter permease [Thermomicrobiales bacterium]|nr:iron ABC transporter permease [Thermomicrobiales bacterium]
MSVSSSSTISNPVPAERETGRLRRPTRAAGLVILLAVAAFVALLSLRFGSLTISTRDAWNGIFDYHADVYQQTIVRELRLPRTVIALCVGGALAVAGTVMQGVTRNPLAGPSILGVSQGASLAVAVSVTYLGMRTPGQYIWMAFLGALGASALVFAVGSAGKGGASPVKLALAGVVISALLSAWTSTLLLLNEDTLDTVRFWLAGSVAGRDLDILWTVSPFLIGGVVACIFLGHQLNVLSMGEDNARSLGMNTTRTRLIASVFVILITGAAVSVAGPIGFVGLATPHIARAVVGADYRWILPYSFAIGAILLTAADVAGRLVTRPAELQVGIITALVGAPFLVYLARSTRVAN